MEGEEQEMREMVSVPKVGTSEFLEVAKMETEALEINEESLREEHIVSLEGVPKESLEPTSEATKLEIEEVIEVTKVEIIEERKEEHVVSFDGVPEISLGITSEATELESDEALEGALEGEEHVVSLDGVPEISPEPISEITRVETDDVLEALEREINEESSEEKHIASPDGVPTVEDGFRDLEVPSWREQLTLRAFVAAFFLSIMFTFMVMGFNLSTGYVPSLNVAAGFLGYFTLKLWTMFLDKVGLLRQPFTRQENALIQTCIVTSSSIAFSGGFGTYLYAMSKEIAIQVGEGNRETDVVDLSLKWIVGFLFLVSFNGLIVVVLLRKFMIISCKLTYPSGTTIANLINDFHIPQGSELAKNKLNQLGIATAMSFLWACLQWFFAAGHGCGFKHIPTFGLKAYRQKFYFDFSLTYVGAGMKSSYKSSISLLSGAIISWGFMWPMIAKKKGQWYDAKLSDSSFEGLQGYKAFIAIATILGDGLFNFIVVLCQTIMTVLYPYIKKNFHKKASTVPAHDAPALTYDNEVRTQHFEKEPISAWVAVALYLALASICIIFLPVIYVQIKWYQVLTLYTLAPFLAFCNAYGCGHADQNLAATHGRLVIFLVAAWVGGDHGGIIAGLGACGIITNIVSAASDLMQDQKTAYMTLTSPKSMLVSQFIGTVMGCIISPCVFLVYSKTVDDLGAMDSDYPVPNAEIYRNMGIIGAKGFIALPKNCFKLCCFFFVVAVAINLVRECGKWYNKSWVKFIPVPTMMAIPFYIGGYFAIDMCVGSLIVLVWRWKWKANEKKYSSAIASGLICGEGLWTTSSSILAVARVKPPICMSVSS